MPLTRFQKEFELGPVRTTGEEPLVRTWKQDLTSGFSFPDRLGQGDVTEPSPGGPYANFGPRTAIGTYGTRTTRVARARHRAAAAAWRTCPDVKGPEPDGQVKDAIDILLGTSLRPGSSGLPRPHLDRDHRGPLGGSGLPQALGGGVRSIVYLAGTSRAATGGAGSAASSLEVGSIAVSAKGAVAGVTVCSATTPVRCRW